MWPERWKGLVQISQPVSQPPWLLDHFYEYTFVYLFRLCWVFTAAWVFSSCGAWGPFFVAVCRFLRAEAPGHPSSGVGASGLRALGAPGPCSTGSVCGMWVLVFQPGIEPGPPVLRVWSLSHWTTREVPGPFFEPSSRSSGREPMGQLWARSSPSLKTSWGPPGILQPPMVCFSFLGVWKGK